MRNVRLLAVFLTGLGLLLVRPAGAADRFVGRKGSDAANDCTASAAPCRTVAAAIAQAGAGDTIKIATGSFAEALTAPATPLTLSGGWTTDFVSQDPVAHPTTIRRLGAAVQSLLTVDGSADLVVDGVVFSNASSKAYALLVDPAAPGDVHLTLSRTVFTHDKTPIGIFGSGVVSVDVVLSRCQVTGAAGSPAIRVGALSGAAMTVRIENTLIARNSGTKFRDLPYEPGAGAALDLTTFLDGSSLAVDVVHSTLTQNRSNTFGGAVLLDGNVTLTLQNTVDQGNLGPTFIHPSMPIDVTVRYGATLRMDHSDVGVVDVPLGGGTVVDLGGNTSVAAGFVNPKRDFHLLATSPLVDAGADAGVTVDLDGHARPQDGNGDTVAVSDVGAYERLP